MFHSKGDRVGVYPVFDRPDKNVNILEKWPRSLVVPFDNFVRNQRILDAIRKSIAYRLGEEEFRRVLQAV